MKTSRLMAFALAISVMAVAMIVAGCSSTSTPTPTATPTPTPTPVPATPTPANQTAWRTYEFVEQYAAALEYYNTGVVYINMSANYSQAQDYTSASRYASMAADRMDMAGTGFEGMLWYASTNEQTLLSQDWTNAADLFSKSYRNLSLGYQEYANESVRTSPNYVMGNYYLAIAQDYNNQAHSQWLQATTLGNSMSFAVPTTVPAK